MNAGVSAFISLYIEEGSGLRDCCLPRPHRRQAGSYRDLTAFKPALYL